jgi:3-hydroxy-3-methylglutaryl CoA synthase
VHDRKALCGDVKDTLKESIQHEVHLLEPKYLDHAFNVARKLESKNMSTRRVDTNNYREYHVPSPSLTQPTRLTPQQMDEKIAKGLYFNRDNKYINGHTCGENKLFYIDREEEEDQELNHRKIWK